MRKNFVDLLGIIFFSCSLQILLFSPLVQPDCAVYLVHAIGNILRFRRYLPGTRNSTSTFSSLSANVGFPVVIVISPLRFVSTYYHLTRCLQAFKVFLRRMAHSCLYDPHCSHKTENARDVPRPELCNGTSFASFKICGCNLPRKRPQRTPTPDTTKDCMNILVGRPDFLGLIYVEGRNQSRHALGRLGIGRRRQFRSSVQLSQDGRVHSHLLPKINEPPMSSNIIFN